MRWPWQHHKRLTAERQEAEAAAKKTHREIIRPLREMREHDQLRAAIVDDIRAQAQDKRNRP